MVFKLVYIQPKVKHLQKEDSTNKRNFGRNKICFRTTIFQRWVLVVLRWMSQALLTFINNNSHVGRKEMRKLHSLCVKRQTDRHSQNDGMHVDIQN